ncbi:MAG: ArnT family glycosyltransferase [Candidatus Binatia bacterium]
MKILRGVPRRAFAAAALLPLVVFTTDLGMPSLWDPDEGRHAEIAREMLLTGERLTPKLNSEPYREKLPVYYWALAASFAAFGGRNEAAARLPSAVLAVLGVWAAIAWGSRHFRPLTGAIAGLVLATTAGYAGAGRLALIDAPYSILLSLALLSMGASLVGTRTGFPFAFYGALAAATLVRGPVAVVSAALIALVFAFAVAEPRRLLRLRPLRGIALLAALVGPVYGWIAAADPRHLPEFLWRYNVLRFLRADVPGTHEEPFLFFLWFTPLLMLPWAVFLPWSLRDAARKGSDRAPEARLYCLCWALVIVGFFTLSAAKFPSYTLPALLPLSLLTARFLDRELRRPASSLREPLFFGGIVLFAVVLVAPIVGYQVVGRLFPTYAEKTAYLLLLVPLALAGLATVAMRSRAGTIAAITACSAILVLGLYRFGAGTVSAFNSMEVPAELIAGELPPAAPLVSYRTTSHSLSFYSGRPVRSFDSIGEAASFLASREPVALLTKRRHLPEVRAAIPVAWYFWWESDSKKVLLVNRPSPAGGDRRILLPLSASAGFRDSVAP